MAQPQKLLITGASGFIGQHVTRLALAQGDAVLNVDLRPAPVTDFQSHYMTLVRNVSDLKAQDLAGITGVIHLAATVSVPLCEENPAQSTENNLNLLLGLLEILPPSVPIVFASSSAVYGDLGEKNAFLNESDLADWPLSFYAAQKRACEIFLKIACLNQMRRATALRFFNVYGEGQDPSSPYSGVLSRFLSLAQKGEALTVHGDGSQTRDFVAVQDVARSVLLALQSLYRTSTPHFSVYNIGTGQRTSISALTQMIAHALGRPISVLSAPARSGDIKNSCADITLVTAELGLRIETDLQLGLKALTQSRFIP